MTSQVFLNILMQLSIATSSAFYRNRKKRHLRGLFSFKDVFAKYRIHVLLFNGCKSRTAQFNGIDVPLIGEIHTTDLFSGQTKLLLSSSPINNCILCTTSSVSERGDMDSVSKLRTLNQVIYGYMYIINRCY